jgi:hypothetical protein
MGNRITRRNRVLGDRCGFSRVQRDVLTSAAGSSPISSTWRQGRQLGMGYL